MMNVMMTMVLAGVGTYLLRAALVALPDGVALPSPLTQRLPLIGPAVLAAIVASALVGADRGLPVPAEGLAVVAAFLAVRRFGNPGVALLVGLPIYWGLSAVGLG